MTIRNPALPLALAVLAALAGCGGDEAVDLGDREYKDFRVADGTEFSGWVSRINRPGEACWIWCSLLDGDASFRIVGEGQPGTWKPMIRYVVEGLGEDDPYPSDDGTGQLGAAVELPRGQYGVHFRIGTEVFTGVTLFVE